MMIGSITKYPFESPLLQFLNTKVVQLRQQLNGFSSAKNKLAFSETLIQCYHQINQSERILFKLRKSEGTHGEPPTLEGLSLDQSQGQSQVQDQSQGQSQGQSQDQSQGQDQGQSKGQSQGQNQGQSQGQDQDQGQSKGQSQGQNQSQCQSQGQDQDQGQIQSQGQDQDQGQIQSQGQDQNQGQHKVQTEVSLPSLLEEICKVTILLQQIASTHLSPTHGTDGPLTQETKNHFQREHHFRYMGNIPELLPNLEISPEYLRMDQSEINFLPNKREEEVVWKKTVNGLSRENTTLRAELGTFQNLRLPPPLPEWMRGNDKGDAPLLRECLRFQNHICSLRERLNQIGTNSDKRIMSLIRENNLLRMERDEAWTETERLKKTVSQLESDLAKNLSGLNSVKKFRKKEKLGNSVEKYFPTDNVLVSGRENEKHEQTDEEKNNLEISEGQDGIKWEIGKMGEKLEEYLEKISAESTPVKYFPSPERSQWLNRNHGKRTLLPSAEQVERPFKRQKLTENSEQFELSQKDTVEETVAVPNAGEDQDEKTNDKQPEIKPPVNYVITFSGFKNGTKYNTRLKNVLTKKALKLSAEVKISDDLDDQVTHLICPPGSCTLKTLAAIASRRWVLPAAWILDSGKEGKFLPEENYGVKPKQRIYENKKFFISKSLEATKINCIHTIAKVVGGSVVDSQSQADYVIVDPIDEPIDQETLTWNQFLVLIADGTGKFVEK